MNQPQNAFEKFKADVKAAKPGDTIDVKGLKVLVQTPEQCEQAAVHICMRTADMPTVNHPSIKGVCSQCGAEIWIMLEGPAKPPKVCQVCALPFLDEILDQKTLTE